MIAIRVLIFSFLIPNEFNFALGDLILSPYRVTLICLVPFLVRTFSKEAHLVNWNICDLFALGIGLWPFAAFSLNTGVGAAFESGGILALELTVPYFLIRLNVTTHTRRVELSKILFLTTIILVAVGLPESLFGRHYTHEIASALTGSIYTGIAEQRFGVWRAMGPTDHAIIFGTLCAIAMPAAVFLAQRRAKYWFIAVLSGAGAVMSASSAPILAVLVQLGMLAWARLTRGIRSRWWILLALFVVFYIVIDLISNRDPVRVMFSYLLLNPETGYARYYMWINSFEVATQSTWGWIFGYGYSIDIFDVIDNFYWRNLLQNTVDSFWLVLMLRFGIVMLILFTIFMSLVFARSLKHVFGPYKRKERYFMQAWFITAFTMSLIAATIHFWGYMACMYMMVMAVCVGGERSTSRRQRKRRPKPLVDTNLSGHVKAQQNVAD